MGIGASIPSCQQGSHEDSHTRPAPEPRPKRRPPKQYPRYVLETLEIQHGTILSKLLEYQQHEVFGDLSVKLKDCQIRAMSPLMAAMSPVFDIMLRTEMREKRSGEVALPEVSRETWNTIVHFYFSSEKLITEENICDVLCVCNMYQMEDMKAYCDDLLSSFCTAENCLTMQKVAKDFCLPVSTRKIAQFIAENFAQITKTEFFLSQDEEEVLDLLKNPNVITTEDDLCRSVLNWLEAHDSQADVASKVFSELRLWRMSSEFLFQDVMYNSIVTNNGAIRKAIQNEVKTRVHRPESSRIPQTPPQRRGNPTPPMDLVILGHDSRGMYFFFCTSRNREWRSLPLPPKKTRSAAVFLNGNIIVTGGYEDGEKRSTQVFNITSKEWSRGPDLVEGRYDHGMTIISEMAYVVGGSLPCHRSQQGTLTPSALSIRLSSIEELNCARNVWEHKGNLQIPASEFGVASIGVNILVLGNTPSSEAQNVLQVFNVSTGVGTILETQLTCCIYPVRGISANDVVYFLGEYGDFVRIHKAEDRFHVARHVKLARYGSRYRCGANICHHHLWVLGGHSNGYLNTVACYDLNGKEGDNSSIQPLPTPMEICGVFSIQVPEACSAASSEYRSSIHKDIPFLDSGKETYNRGYVADD